MPKRIPPLKPQESRILKALLEHNYYLNTTQVAQKANVSWNTADKYLKKFRKSRWIDKKEIGNRDYWRAYRRR
jgi:predicted transcriptional regulator